ncbi:MAG: ATP-binding protein [Candidatus Eisenbacteria bacterium]|jgi:serine/threonine-protein kinase RsbW|nr:ATP-binding protein [Candidatus Eisenbacteria bacterium]
MNAESFIRTISLELPSDVRFLELAHCLGKEIPQALGVPESEAEAIGNAVLEAVGNAMRHGNRLDPSLPVALRFEVDSGTFQVSIGDRGVGFDPDALADPTTGENLMKSCGRGLFLMRAFVDTVQVCPREGGGTTVTLRKSFGP